MKILEFPDSRQRDFIFLEGVVTVKLNDNEPPLTASAIMFMLEMSKVQLIDFLKT